MQAANDNTLTRLQLEINRALVERNETNLMRNISRYMQASDMSATLEMLQTIPLQSYLSENLALSQKK